MAILYDNIDSLKNYLIVDLNFEYSFLYENDHFNQAQAEFKKELNGQSKPVAQKKRRKKRRVCTMHSGSGLVHTLQKMDHLLPSISLLLQLDVNLKPQCKMKCVCHFISDIIDQLLPIVQNSVGH